MIHSITSPKVIQEKSMYPLFEHYIRQIRSFPQDEHRLPESLLLKEKGNLKIYYAPFDYLNRDAKIAIVGITPGKTQAVAALGEARRILERCGSVAAACEAAKKKGSFAELREPLTDMLDHIGLQRVLELGSCSELFEEKRRHLIHTTSVIRYPTFKKGERYNGSPSFETNTLLKSYLSRYLLEEIRELDPEVLWITLGEHAAKALEFAVRQGVVDSSRVLSGIPHPSGANKERILYFLDRKERCDLSKQVRPDKIDANKKTLCKKVEVLYRREVQHRTGRRSGPE